MCIPFSVLYRESILNTQFSFRSFPFVTVNIHCRGLLTVNDVVIFEFRSIHNKHEQKSVIAFLSTVSDILYFTRTLRMEMCFMNFN